MARAVLWGMNTFPVPAHLRAKRGPVVIVETRMHWFLNPITLGFLMVVALVAALMAEEPPVGTAGSSVVSFVNATAEQKAVGPKVVASIREQLMKLTGRELGHMPIEVRLVEELGRGNASCLATGRMQGVEFQTAGVFVIEILKNGSSSFGRVLAHEMTHALLHEAYGEILNRTLNEGMAEYMASQDFSMEVSRDFRAALNLSPMPAKLRPYVEGQKFCQRHATENGFAAFLAAELGQPDGGGAALQEAWKQRVQQHVRLDGK